MRRNPQETADMGHIYRRNSSQKSFFVQLYYLKTQK